MEESIMDGLRTACELLDLKLFKKEEYASLDKVEQLAVFGFMCYELSKAIEYSELADYGEEMLSIAETQFSNSAALGGATDCAAFFKLYSGARFITVWEKHQSKFACTPHEKTEFYLQELFKKHAEYLVQGSQLIKKKHDGKNIPDAWLRIGDVEIPVEMKKGNFDKNALMQLQRYMTAYNSIAGIAVGKKLTVNLPKGIMFIPSRAVFEAEATDELRNLPDVGEPD